MTETETLWDEAVAHANAGRSQEADALCAQLIAVAPAHAEAWHMRGRFALQSGGNNDQQQQLATNYFAEAIKIAPNEAKYHHGLGLALRTTGDDDGAIAALQMAIDIKPDFAEAVFEIGAIGESTGNLEQAAGAYEQAVTMRPGFLEAHHNLAGVYRRLGQIENSISHARMALALAHDNPVVRFSLAVGLEQAGDHEEAVDHYQEAIRLRPDYVQAENNLGRLLEAMGRNEEAATLLEAAVSRHPNNAGLLTNLGNTYLKVGKPTAAQTALEKSVEITPGSAPSWNSLAVCQMLSGKMADAIRCYREAIRLNPQFAEAHENLAQALLASGEWSEGWAEYEWRWKNPVNTLTERKIGAPLWDGTALNGRTLLLHAEQGLGDTLQMARYIDQIQKGGGTIILACQPSLIRLLSELEPLDIVVPLSRDWPTCDIHAPLFSLPRIFETSLEQIPTNIPYIPVPDHQLIELPTAGGEYRIAICWAGREKYAGDPYRDRSCPAAYFTSLSEMPGVSVYSLQHGTNLTEAAKYAAVVDLTAQLSDFSDDAQALQQMDLVISVDTALAHLAGALGVPCWLVLPYAADWRWMSDRDDSPWYPSMELFRQTSPGDWRGVFDRIRMALENRSDSRK